MAQSFSTDQILRAADNAYRQGKIADAIMLCHGALEAEPRNPQGLFMLGTLRGLEGKTTEAIATLREAVAVAPDFLEASIGLAGIVRASGNLSEAIEVCERFIERSPSRALAHGMLGTCYFEAGRFTEAVDAFQTSCEINPKSYDAWVGLGRALLCGRRPQEAEDAFRIAVAINDSDPMCHSSLGQALQEAGRFEEAAVHFERSIDLAPQIGLPYLGLALGSKISSEDESLAVRIKDQLGNSDLHEQDRRLLEYALGKALDDLGRYEEAMGCFDRATELTVRQISAGTRFDARAEAAGIDFTLRTFTEEFIEEHGEIGLESDWPIFVVGVPRSGTTLLEQMLTNHPAIGSAGELPFWVDQGRSTFEALGSQDQVRRTAEQYLELLAQEAPGKARVIDKMPTNYTSLGLLSVLFPNAKLIHCRRHAVDTCLSLYMNAHSISPMPFGNTKADLVEGYQGYLRAMDHWRRVLPADRFLELNYEELVSCPEPVLSRVISFCGLEWDESCLHPESNPRDVSTPSRWQVRQPVYKGSVERWRRYEPWLGEFRRLLPETER